VSHSPTDGSGKSLLFGERLRAAREYRERTQADLGRHASLAKETISRWENTFRLEIADQALTAIASSLQFPRAFFATPPTELPSPGSLRFRAKASITKHERAALARRAEVVHELVAALAPLVSWTNWTDPRVQPTDSPADIAAETRACLGVDVQTPLPHLIRLVEGAGIAVVSLDWDEDLDPSDESGGRAPAHHDSFSTWIGSGLERPLIAVRSIQSWERTRFNVAHELAHLVLHHDRASIDHSIDPELAANTLASELLLPSAPLREEVFPDSTLDELLPVKMRWGVSIQAIIQHAHRHQIIDDARRTSLYKQISNRGWRTSEPAHNAFTPERPRSIAKVLEVAYGHRPTLGELSALAGHWPADAYASIIRSQEGRPSEDDDQSDATVLPISTGTTNGLVGHGTTKS
jgi:Zn-dependent peptidase ImmA (M78 family)/transcriptional regulator with XRE-family HTH domain